MNSGVMFGTAGDNWFGYVLLLSMQKIIGSSWGMSHLPVAFLIQSLEVKSFHIVSCRVLYFTAGLLFGVGVKRG